MLMRYIGGGVGHRNGQLLNSAFPATEPEDLNATLEGYSMEEEEPEGLHDSDIDLEDDDENEDLGFSAM
jgi:hypothetical protein